MNTPLTDARTFTANDQRMGAIGREEELCRAAWARRLETQAGQHRRALIELSRHVLIAAAELVANRQHDAASGLIDAAREALQAADSKP